MDGDYRVRITTKNTNHTNGDLWVTAGGPGRVTVTPGGRERAGDRETRETGGWVGIQQHGLVWRVAARIVGFICFCLLTD